MLQPTQGQDLSTDCWPHFHLCADRSERSSSQFRDDVWAACRIPPSSNRCWLSLPILRLQTSSYQNSSWYWVGTYPIHWSKISPPPGIELAFNLVIRVNRTMCDHGTGIIIHTIIIIITIIGSITLLRVLVPSRNFFHSSRSRAITHLFFIPSILVTSSDLSLQRSICISPFLLPIGYVNKIFWIISWSSFLITLSAHLDLVNLIWFLISKSLNRAYSSWLSLSHIGHLSIFL